MIYFESQYFQKFDFSETEIKRFLAAAHRDLEIAIASDVPEVIFKFSFDALIKFGITVIASQKYKARSVPGHHVKILEKLSEFLNNEEVAVIGNRMRQVRNFDFYEGGSIITDKESGEYLNFVKSVAARIAKKISLKR